MLAMILDEVYTSLIHFFYIYRKFRIQLSFQVNDSNIYLIKSTIELLYYLVRATFIQLFNLHYYCKVFGSCWYKIANDNSPQFLKVISSFLVLLIGSFSNFLKTKILKYLSDDLKMFLLLTTRLQFILNKTIQVSNSFKTLCWKILKFKKTRNQVALFQKVRNHFESAIINIIFFFAVFKQAAVYLFDGHQLFNNI